MSHASLLLILAFGAVSLRAVDFSVEQIRLPTSLPLSVPPLTRAEAIVALPALTLPTLRLPASTLPASLVSISAPALPRAEAAAAGAAGAAHPLIERAQRVAASLGTTPIEAPPADAVAGTLSRMNSDGFTIVPPGALFSARTAAQVLAEISAKWKKDSSLLYTTWDVYDEFKGLVRNVGQQPDGSGGVKVILEALTTRLRQALPGENIQLRNAQLRLRPRDAKEDESRLHIDGDYITATIALQGPGTLLYPLPQKGHLEEIAAPVNSVALITNERRELITGVPGTVHSSPTPDRYGKTDRIMLIIRFKRSDTATFSDARREAGKRRMDSRVLRIQQLRRARDERGNRT